MLICAFLYLCVSECVFPCVCRSVGFAPVTVDGLGGMSITHTVQLSASYKENKIEGGKKRGREESSCGLIFNLKQDGGWIR